MRFRRKGTNWEGRTWATTPALNKLLDEIEGWQPTPRSVDGTVASAGHDDNNPASDHRPTPYTGFGFVRAVDVGETGAEGDVLAEALRDSRDSRLRYVIHNRRIFASYTTSTRPAWEWGAYSGYNAHLTHVHVSVAGSDTDTTPWNLNLGDDPMAFLPLQEGDGYPDRPDHNQDVRLLQDMLNRAYNTKLVVDGKYGPSTVAAFAEHIGGDGKNVRGRGFENLLWAYTRKAAGGDHSHSATVELS